MEKKKLGGLLLALWLAVLPLYGAMCFADTADDKRAELNDVRQRMERMQTRKEQARRKAESASAELSEVMDNLNELQAQANNLQKKSSLDVAWAFALHIRPQRDRQILGVPWVDRCAELMHGSYAKQFAVCAAQDADMYFSTGQPRQLRLRALVPWRPVVAGPCN